MADPNNNSTILEKLDYLEGTKDSIRNAIIAKGQEVTENDTFRSYAVKISNIETGIDTSDADATAQDIMAGKTAYVDGEKIEGILVPKEGIQLFETEEDMQQDGSKNQGDLAVVYSDNYSELQAGVSFNEFKCPSEVIFDEIIDDTYTASSYTDGMDIYVRLTNTQFYINGYNMYTGDNFSVYFDSSDGKTYTRRASSPEKVKLSATISFNTFDEHLSPFILVGGMSFGGIFMYDTYIDKNYYNFLSNVYYDGIMHYNLTPINNKNTLKAKELLEIYNSTISDFYGILTRIDPLNEDHIIMYTFCRDNNLNYMYGPNLISFYNDNNEKKMFIGYGENNSATNGIIIYRYDITVSTKNIIKTIPNLQTKTIGNYKYYYINELISDPCLQLNGPMSGGNPYTYLYAPSTSSQNRSDISLTNSEFTKYRIADSQYSLENSDQLYENITGYGKEGNITGDGSIIDKIGIIDTLERVCNIDTKKLPILISPYGSYLSSNPSKLISGNNTYMKCEYTTERNYNNIIGVVHNKDYNVIGIYKVKTENNIQIPYFEVYNFIDNEIKQEISINLDTSTDGQLSYCKASVIQCTNNLAYFILCTHVKLYVYKLYNGTLSKILEQSGTYNSINSADISWQPYLDKLYDPINNKLYISTLNYTNKLFTIISIDNNDIINQVGTIEHPKTGTKYNRMGYAQGHIYFMAVVSSSTTTDYHNVGHIDCSNDNLNVYTISNGDFRIPDDPVGLFQDKNNPTYCYAINKFSRTGNTSALLKPNGYEIISNNPFYTYWGSTYSVYTNIDTTTRKGEILSGVNYKGIISFDDTSNISTNNLSFKLGDAKDENTLRALNIDQYWYYLPPNVSMILYTNNNGIYSFYICSYIDNVNLQDDYNYGLDYLRASDTAMIQLSNSEDFEQLENQVNDLLGN